MIHRAVVVLAAWPLLLGTTTPAPQPPEGFAGGLSAPANVMEPWLGDARTAGFNAVRIFLRWDKIETVEGALDWTCRYITDADVAGDPDRDGTRDLWPGIPCDSTSCGCGLSADERVSMAARSGMSILLTMVGTPTWARGQAGTHCPPDTPGRALPLRRDKESAYRTFVGAVAERYGSVAYAFELWNEPDLAECQSWAGTRQQYKEQILAAAAAVKASGALPGLVVAPTLENPSGAAMDAWIDWSQPIDRLSFNLYKISLSSALAKVDEMSAWCAERRRCPGFYITEFGAHRLGPRSCPGPRTDGPGSADVAIMKRCQKRRSCAGFFLYALSDRKRRPECDRGLVAARGCRKRRFCTIARRFFGVTALPFDCAGCDR